MRRTSSPSPKSRPSRQTQILEERFLLHESRAKEQTDQLKGSLNELKDDVKSLADKVGEQHTTTLNIMAAHTTKLELHEHRINSVEKAMEREVDEDKKAIEKQVDEHKQYSSTWRQWWLGIFAALISAGLGGLLSHTFFR